MARSRRSPQGGGHERRHPVGPSSLPNMVQSHGSPVMAGNDGCTSSPPFGLLPGPRRGTQAAPMAALMFDTPCVACQPSCQISTAVRSPQRHQGGARRAGDSRGGECPATLIWHGSWYAVKVTPALGAPTQFAAEGADWVSRRGQGGARRAGDTSGGTQSAPAARPISHAQPHSPPASPTCVTIQP